MTQPLTMERFDEALPPGAIPALGSWVVARDRIAEQLDLGVTGLLTLVQAPGGAGKTTSVASWALRLPQARGLAWLTLDQAASRPGAFMTRLVDVLRESGVPGLPVIGPAHQLSPAQRRTLVTALASALHGTGPWVLVLDDFPTGACGQLGTDVETLMQEAGRALRVVALASAEPAIELHRLKMAGEVATITSRDLDLTRDETAAALAAFGIDATAHVVDEVQRHTHGWAAGVHLAATTLATKPVEVAIGHVVRTVEDFLVAEVLDALPPDSRELVMRSSVADSVPAGLADAIMGADSELARIRAARGSAFVSHEFGGTLQLHPLLRDVVAARLRKIAPEQARSAHVAASHWYAAEGDLDAAARAAAGAEEWALVARRLVEAFAVPRILDGTYVSQLLTTEVLNADPVLLAAVALAQGHVAAAQHAIAAVDAPSAHRPAALLSGELVGMAIARRAGNVGAGLAHGDAARGLLDAWPLTMSAPAVECQRRVDNLAGQLELMDGRLNQAATTLQRPSAEEGSPRGARARREALGHFALVEAIRGNLGSALAKTDEVLLAASRFGGDAGVDVAQLAAAWVYTDRAEHVEARGRLGSTRTQFGVRDPLVVVTSTVLQARLSTVEGRPEDAVRLITSLQGCDNMPAPGWLADLLQVELARALNAAGEPHRALAAVTPEPEQAAVEGRVVAAHARMSIGDVRGARALLVAVSPDLGPAPRAVQVEAWLLEARIACDADDRARARQLVERALRAAGAEGLRSSVAGSGPWLRSFVGRDLALVRAHRELLAHARLDQSPQQSVPSEPAPTRLDEQVVETLTERECQVLELLALMCSTDEIAAELYVSGNTVKTHVKGIFRKLGVSRRVDAVRVGRSHGLC